MPGAARVTHLRSTTARRARKARTCLPAKNRPGKPMKKKKHFVWFESEAEEATKFYVGISKNSKIGKIAHYAEDGPRPKGSVMTEEFRLGRVEFVALNGGAQFKFTEAI